MSRTEALDHREKEVFRPAVRGTQWGMLVDNAIVSQPTCKLWTAATTEYSESLRNLLWKANISQNMLLFNP